MVHHVMASCMWVMVAFLMSIRIYPPSPDDLYCDDPVIL